MVEQSAGRFQTVEPQLSGLSERVLFGKIGQADEIGGVHFT